MVCVIFFGTDHSSQLAEAMVSVRRIRSVPPALCGVVEVVEERTQFHDAVKEMVNVMGLETPVAAATRLLKEGSLGCEREAVFVCVLESPSLEQRHSLSEVLHFCILERVASISLAPSSPGFAQESFCYCYRFCATRALG